MEAANAIKAGFENAGKDFHCICLPVSDGGEGLREAIAHSERVSDYVSRELFEDILESEEEHIDWLETQFKLIDDIGIANYLQSQAKPASS